jgi:hypothetical protein
MAAPTKQGIDYFPYDVDLDQDDKLGMIIGEFGEKGERLWLKMLAWTYKNEGYFFEYKEDVQLRFLRRYNYCGFSMSFIQEVVPRFIRWGLFNESVFNEFQILTSVRIQKTWLDASRKRIGRRINKNYWLIEVNGGLMAEETKEKAAVIDKVKEIKVKEIKVKTLGDKSPPKEKKVYWNAFVETFEKFYITEFKEKYSYLAKDFGCLDKIYNFLKSRAELKKNEWTEKLMIESFNYFLNTAFQKDNWLKKNFSIPNILSQFNQIANATGTGKNTHQQSPAGSKQTGADAIAAKLAANLAQAGQGGTTGFGG